jgi:tetratricopeptide (TPR) repeat protein
VQQTAIVLAQDLHDPTAQANADRSLGATYAWQGKYREALREDTEALAVLNQLPDSEDKKRVRMATLNNIGNVYNLQRQLALAEDYYHQALALANQRRFRRSSSPSRACQGASAFGCIEQRHTTGTEPLQG